MKKAVFFAIAIAALVATLIFSFAGCAPAPPTAKCFVHADGALIKDKFDEPVGLVGTNLGGWLVQESWLVPTDVGEEYGHIDMLVELANRFGKERADELIKIYEDNWVTEADLAFVKSLGMNCVRLPFSYMTLCDAAQLDETTGKYARTPYAELELKQDAFARLDQALAMCKKYGLYLILDMHGAVGSQNGNDHSGDISRHNEGGDLWREDETGEICREKTKELWVAIAERYKDERDIAFFDLLNEPGIKDADGNQKTDERVFEYFDELYDAIRAVDPNHAICMESCWEAGDLPNPSDYGWTNVIYQYHHYNWTSMNMLNSSFYQLKMMTASWLPYSVPTFIGEFNVWGDRERNGRLTQTDEEAWSGVVELYAGLGWHFTTWNFKHAAKNSTWGLLNAKSDVAQANFRTDSFERIAECWRAANSTNYAENTTLTACITPHLSNFNATLEEAPADFAILKR